jgi:outer membrane protein TolC
VAKGEEAIERVSDRARSALDQSADRAESALDDARSGSSGSYPTAPPTGSYGASETRMSDPYETTGTTRAVE